MKTMKASSAFLLLLTILLIGCVKSLSIPPSFLAETVIATAYPSMIANGKLTVSPSPAQLVSLTATLLPATITPTRALSPTISPITIPFPSSQTTFRYQKNCLVIEKAIPPAFLSNGAILLEQELAEGVQPYFFTTQNNNLQPILSMPTSGERQISPDGKKLAYESIREVNGQSKRYLEVRSADGQNWPGIPYKGNWESLLYWLDNERVVIGTDSKQEVIVNISTGESFEFDFTKLGAYVDIASFPLFDILLTHTVFLRGTNNFSYVLWDLQAGKTLWELPLKYEPWSIEP